MYHVISEVCDDPSMRMHTRARPDATARPDRRTTLSNVFVFCFFPVVSHRCSHGVAGYHVRLTCGRSPVRSWVGVLFATNLPRCTKEQENGTRLRNYVVTLAPGSSAP